jgi:hypothetical protein
MVKFAYTKWRNWLRIRLAKTNELTPLSNLKKAYEDETGIKLTNRAYEIGLKVVGKGQIRRNEQLYWFPKHLSEGKRTSRRMVRMVGGNANSHNQSNELIHSSHRYRFSIAYIGVQPRDGKIRPWGRNKQMLQVEYDYEPGMRLQVFSKRIIVMLANPEGITTQEQQIEARRLSYLTILAFCKERKLELEGNLEKKLGTHHVLELEQANTTIQESLGKFEKEIEARTGSLIMGDSSHINKLEHQGGGESLTQGQQAALGFEWLLWKFPQQFGQLTEGMMGEYNKNLKLHIEIMQDIKITLKEMRDTMKKVKK